MDGLQGQVWLGTQWQVARALAAQAGSCVLVLDEIQKVSNWTEEVKRLWDEDTATGRDVRVIILGSAPLLIARGLSESGCKAESQRTRAKGHECPLTDTSAIASHRPSGHQTRPLSYP